MKFRKEGLYSNSGYILLYTLFISLIISTVILFSITIIYFQNAQVVREINKKKLELACFSGVQKYLSNLNTLENKDCIINIDSVFIRLSCRIKGLYYEITAKSKKYKDSSEIVYLFGNKIITPFDNAVILTYPNLKASVAGNTKITGNILATSNIFRYESILGITSRRKNFIEGKIILSNKIIQKLFNETIYLQNINALGNERPIILPGGFILNKFSISNLDSAKLFIINGDFLIEGELNFRQKYISNIFDVKGRTFIKSNTKSNLDLQIYSDSSININDNSTLHNLILFAQKDIIVKSKCELSNVQMFADKNISIESSELKYPSTVGIYVNTDNPLNLKNNITVHSSKINGTIVLLSSIVGLGNNQSKILIDENSIVQGLLYSENYTEIAGIAVGTVYTYAFRFYKEPTEYLNWLVNLEVNRNKLSKWFLLPIGFSKKPELQIMEERWIY